MSHESVNATHYEQLPTYPPKGGKHEHRLHVVIETPMRSRHKYALNNDYGLVAFSEVLPASLEWPFDYGFIPQTLADDGDPLDILVLTENGLFPGCFIVVRVLGAVRLKKDGVENDRLIGVPAISKGAPQPTDAYRDINDLPPEKVARIRNFLVEYSSLQGHNIAVESIVGANDAMKLVKKSTKQYKKAQPN